MQSRTFIAQRTWLSGVSLTRTLGGSCSAGVRKPWVEHSPPQKKNSISDVTFIAKVFGVGNIGELSQSVQGRIRDFLFGILVVLAIFYVALLFEASASRVAVFEFGGRVLGSSIPAAVAYFGVMRTIENSRKQDLLKEWHSNLRWATDLCASQEPKMIALGVTAIVSLDDAPFLGDNENDLVDSLVNQIAKSWDPEGR